MLGGDGTTAVDVELMGSRLAFEQVVQKHVGPLREMEWNIHSAFWSPEEWYPNSTVEVATGQKWHWRYVVKIGA